MQFGQAAEAVAPSETLERLDRVVQRPAARRARPHAAQGDLTPTEFASTCSINQPKAA